MRRPCTTPPRPSRGRYSDRVRVVGPSEHCAEFYPDDQETYEPLTWQNDGWVCVFVPVVFPGTDEPAALHEIAMPNDWPEAMAVDAVNNRLYLGWMARDPRVESHVIVVMDGANEQELWRIPVPAVFDLLLDAPSNRLFIVDPFSPRLLIVDVSEPGGQVVEMPLPLDPRGYLFSGRLPLAIEPTSGALYVGDPAKRRIYRMDPDQPLAAAITIDLPEGTCAANTLVVNAIEKTLFVPGCTGSIEVVDIDQTRATYHTVVGRLLLPSDVALPLWEWEYGRLAVDAASGRLFVAAEAYQRSPPSGDCV